MEKKKHFENAKSILWRAKSHHMLWAEPVTRFNAAVRQIAVVGRSLMNVRALEVSYAV